VDDVVDGGIAFLSSLTVASESGGSILAATSRDAGEKISEFLPRTGCDVRGCTMVASSPMQT
jgi:hypothetical protein